MPSKDPGRVLGFHTPPRKAEIFPVAASFWAVSRYCSRLSALQGPAITKGLLFDGNQKSNGVVEILVGLIVVFNSANLKHAAFATAVSFSDFCSRFFLLFFWKLHVLK
jgi:hypothetical protein